MRYLIAAALALLGCSASQAQPKNPPILVDDSRIVAIETRLDRIEALLAKMSTTGKQNCPNCTVCGDNCPCVGGGLYCGDGKCPIVPRDTEEVVTGTDGVRYKKVCENGRCKWVELSNSSATPTFNFGQPSYSPPSYFAPSYYSSPVYYSRPSYSEPSYYSQPTYFGGFRGGLRGRVRGGCASGNCG